MTTTHSDKTINLAIVSDAVLPWNHGGKETRYAGYIHKLPAFGINTTVFTMKWWEEPEEPTMDGVRFRAISKKFSLYDSAGVRSISQGIKFSVATIKLLFIRNIDVIEADQIPYIQIFPLWIVARIKRIPLLVTWHEYWGRQYWLEYLPGWKGRAGSIVESFVIRLPDHIITVSDEVTLRVTHALGSNLKLTQINSGLPLSEMQKVKAGKAKDTIIYVGRLIEHKRVDLLIDAYRLLVLIPKFKNFKLQIVGKGPEELTLRNLAADLPNCTFEGEITSTSDLWLAIKSAAILVLPSEREGYGLVIAESLALGTPVITSNHLNNAARHLVTEQPGSGLFEYNDSLDLLKGIQSTLANLPSKEKVSESFRKNQQVFDWVKMTQLYSALVKKLVDVGN
jgi:glycosyltransferase involved in cell wall biosynthesis